MFKCQKLRLTCDFQGAALPFKVRTLLALDRLRLHGGACQGDDTPPSWPAAGRCVPKWQELGEKKEEEASLYKEVVNEGGLNDVRVIGGDRGVGGRDFTIFGTI